MKKVFAIGLLLLSSQAFAVNYQSTFNGKRLVLDGATCAGWEFAKNGKTAKWRNEGDCQTSDNYATNWRVLWLDEDNLVMVETEQTNDTSPPRNYVFQVMNVNGKKVILKDYWTGWGNSSNDIDKFTIR